MALTQEESAALMSDITFRGRIKVCCLKFAQYIADEPATTPAHPTRTKWSQRTFAQPDQVASETQPPTVMDTAVQDAGSGITDAALQTAVEATVAKLI